MKKQINFTKLKIQFISSIISILFMPVYEQTFNCTE